DSIEKDVSGFVVAPLAAGELRFGGYEPALAGRLEYRRTVAFQVGPNTLESGHGGVQTGKVGIDLRYDSLLLAKRGQHDFEVRKERLGHAELPGCTLHDLSRVTSNRLL